MFKGLTNYPVFILTLVSLLAISYLSIYVLEKIHNAIINNNINVDTVKLEYVIRDSGVYVKINDSQVNYLYQIVLFQNNSLKIRRLDRLGDVYGPLLLTIDTAEIFLIHPSRKTILDYLVTGSIRDKIVVGLDKYLPPSIAIYLNEKSIDYLKTINGSNKFYRLKPVTYTRSFLIDKDRIYTITENDMVINETSIPLILLNETTIDPNTVDQRFKLLINNYGYVVENREYVLNLYSYMNRYLSSRNIYFSRLITTNPQYLTYTLSLENIVFNQDVFVNTSVFNRVNQVIIRDIYGYTYSANITMKIWLKLSDKYRIFLGSIDFNTDILPSIVLNNCSFIDSGSYRAELFIEYVVKLLQNPIGPTYFTISQTFYGGFEDRIYIKSYVYDKLAIDLGEFNLIYKPMFNNTIVELNITGFQNTTGVFYIVNDEFVSSNFSTNYSGLNNVFVIDWVKPSSLLITPIHVDVLSIDDSKYYLLNSSSFVKTYGVYIINSYPKATLLFNPAIYLDNEYISLRNISEVNILIAKNKVVIVRNNSYGEYSFIRNMYGLIVVEEIEYQYPLICMYNSYGLIFSIRIEYIDGFIDSFVLNNDSCLFIENNILSKVELVFLNNFSGKYVYSVNNDSILLIYDNNRFYSLELLNEIFVLNNVFKLVRIENGFYILI
ncbi:MAG: hypothetical protein QXX35_02250 [Desulfurococcaceae archaeon]